MTSRLRQFAADLATAFRRLVAPKPTRAPRPSVCCGGQGPGHKRTLIVAHNFPQAREYARVNGLKDWVYVASWEQLVGYTAERIRLVKLEGWENGWARKDGGIMPYLERLEEDIRRAGCGHS